MAALRVITLVPLIYSVLGVCCSQAQAQAEPEPRYVVAELKHPSLALKARTELTRRGFRELRVLPGQRLLLERVASSPREERDDSLVSINAYAQAERVSAELLQLPATESAVPILIHGMPGAAASDALGWLTRAGLPLLGSGHAGESLRIATSLPAARAAELATQLARLPEVMFVERVHHVGLFNDRSAGTVQSGTQGAAAEMTPIWAHGLRGEGQILGIIDTGLDADSCYFSSASDKLPTVNTWSQSAGYGTQTDASHSKILAYDFLYSCDQWSAQRDCEDPKQAKTWDSNGHGSHCAGDMAGNRSMGGNNGMAPAAKLVIQDGGAKTNDCADLPGIGCPVVDLYPLFTQAYTQGVRVHNNSWGDNENAPTPKPSNYTARSQDVDRFVWDHKDMLLVFAAGNSGANDAEFSVCSPSTNKNGLSVGSVRNTATSTNDNDISNFSSRGWTADGRIKPDLMAPGCNTSAGNDNDNTTHNCTQNSGCGTSYASPILVGAAALVRQYFTDGFYPTGAKNPADTLQPTAALIKAMLINGAVPLTGKDNAGRDITPIPSNEQGWGRIQLDRSLLFQGAARELYVDEHKQGFGMGSTDAVSYQVAAADPSEPIKITLTWTDAPGSPDGAPSAPKLTEEASWNKPQLVNDLDLSVSDGANMYLGNVFSQGVSMAGGVKDARNNVEQVLLDKPGAGPWTVRVSAGHIMQAGQDYALVITGKWQSAGPAGATGTSPPSAAGAPAAGSAAEATGGAAAAAGTAGTPPLTTPPVSMNASSAGAGRSANVAGVAPAAVSGATAGTGTRLLATNTDQAGMPATPAAQSGGCQAVRTRGNPHSALAGFALLLLIGSATRRRRVVRSR